MLCAVGEVPEWLKGPVLKTGVRASVPWVRIPPPPPQHNPLILNDCISSLLWRVFRGMQGASTPRDLKLEAKWTPKMAQVSVWHLARYGFRVALRALDLIFD